jgi:four helix bundle protein
MGIPLRVLEAARLVVDDINELIDTSRRRLLNEKQLRDAAQSITANLREAQGRRVGAERNVFLSYAAGSSEEADEHLRANYARQRIAPSRYWHLHNRLVVVAKMTASLMKS